MKKINKIIPLMPLIACTSITPFALVSCGQQPKETIEMHNLLDDYTPGQQHEDNTYWNQTEATINYINAVNDNPQIFVDDACLAVKSLISEVPYINISAFDFGVSKPTFGVTNVWQYGAEDFQYSTITVTQKLHIELSTEENDTTKTVWNLDLQVWYNNVVFYAFEDALSDDTGVWNLGLFDYNIENESIWPFISNTEPWYINGSCKSLVSRYGLDEDGNYVLIDNINNYYSSQVNNGRKLINLINYWEELPEDSIEKQIIAIVLFHYKSYYLQKVQNIPEIRLSHILTSNYSCTTHDVNLQLHGLVFIRPTYLKKEWFAGNEPQFVIEIVNTSLAFQRDRSDDPGLIANVIRIIKNSIIQYETSTLISSYRYNLLVPAILGNPWVIPETYLPYEDLLFTGLYKSLYVNMYARDGTEAWTALPWHKSNPLTQSIDLVYNSMLHSILP